MQLKRIMILVMAALAGACSGNVDPDDSKTEGPLEPFTLSVDKSVIESDGKDAAVFTIKDANGLDLTAAQYIKKTSFHINETGEWLSGMVLSQPNKLSVIADGTYTIDAMYDGKACANIVTVKAANRSKYEKFKKKVAIYRLTATWCQYCPSMTEALSKVNSYTKDHSVTLVFHNTDEFAVPYNSSMDLAGALLGRFGGASAGLPFCIYSLAEGSGERKITDIQDFVKTQLYDNPAKTGIKASSAVSGNTITVNATVQASADGKYDLGMAILKDGCKPASSSANESVYNDVVAGISGNFFAMSTDAFDLKAGAEKEISRSWEGDGASGCEIALFTLIQKDSKTIIDNIVVFKAGESIDYILN